MYHSTEWYTSSETEKTVGTPAQPLNYPDKFVENVKKEYPDWDDLHAHLAANSYIVGRYLDDSSSGGISPQRVVAAISSGDEGVKLLREEAESLLRRKALYSEWASIIEAVYAPA